MIRLLAMIHAVLASVLLLSAAAAAESDDASATHRFSYSQVEMAVPIRVVVYARDEAEANAAAEAAFARMHELNGVLSDYDDQSELRRLCETAGSHTAVAVSDDLWQVLRAAQAMSRRSAGAFDATIGPVVRLWRQSRRLKRLPDATRLQAARALVDYQQIQLDAERRTVELAQAGMRLDLGGIAKGYVLAAAMEVLRRHGCGRAMIEGGGDLELGDPPPGSAGWRVAVARSETENDPAAPRELLLLKNAAMATSGDRWQFVLIDGRRYSHIVDPRTGVGLTDQATVTVVHPDGATADALATAVSVLGPRKGMELVDATPDAAAMIMHTVDGAVERVCSQRWAALPRVAAEEAKP